jgi:transcriptional regulator with XRE-family HTH domain
MAHYGRKLAIILAERCVSQTELAGRLECSQVRVTQLIGRARWHLTTVGEIAAALGVPVRYWLGEDDE